ncbi:uncharacterized protein LOC142634585 [Castanea sativa]|uniref:uncharacterized protein LOC142634585 n=1 Tax=Castanea sativa TaxID=21020 RepID=UPI003F64C172
METKIQNFVWKNIVYRFGIPRTIISNNGWQFDSQSFKEFCLVLGIKNQFSSRPPPGQWKDISDEPDIAQDHQNSGGRSKTIVRTQTGETPFRLTYGIEAVIPVEVGINSMRRQVFSESSNDDQLRVNLDFLDEVRDGASQTMTKCQQKMAEYCNKRVKLKRLNIGDLVLRKVTPATKDQTQGKLGLT